MANDFTNKYNTPLSEQEEAEFGFWLQGLSQLNKRDMSKDLFDYDLRGAFKDRALQADDGHFTDKFKKPNHPTFSDESQYHGVDGYKGGKWTEEGDEAWTYEPSATNLEFYTPAELQDYWVRAEQPDKVKLKLPESVRMFPNSNMAP